MYSELTRVGEIFVAIEFLLLLVALPQLFLGFYHASLMFAHLRQGGFSFIKANFKDLPPLQTSPTYQLHERQAVKFRNRWMILIGVMFVFGVVVLVADMASIVHVITWEGR